MDEVCAVCGRRLREGAGFCGGCGNKRGAKMDARLEQAHSAWLDVRFVLVFFVALLAVQVATAILRAAGLSDLQLLGTADILWALVTLVAAARHRDVVIPALTRRGFGPAGYGMVVALALPVALVVDRYVEVMKRLGVPGDDLLAPFAGKSVIWMLLSLALHPAVFEEIGFRGVIYGLLARHVKLWEALIISSVAFGILHMSVISLVTHVPLGLYLCWLRQRSGSLYPGMLAHFLHNAIFVVGTQRGLLH